MKVAVMERIAPELATMVADKNTRMPATLAEVLSPFIIEMGQIRVIHPTTNDPVLVSENLGTVAIWFKI
jgi:hypothetical protein